MPATTPEQIHRLFQDTFNAGDLDGLMQLYDPDAALIAQPRSVAQGSEQVRAALQSFLALKGAASRWPPSRRQPGRYGARRWPMWRGAKPTAAGGM